MKKANLIVLGLAILTSTALDANAFELKVPNLPTAKAPLAQSAKTAKNAANEQYKKEYQAKIEAEQTKLNAVKAYDKQARLSLANVLLTKDKLKEINAISGEEFDEALNTALIDVLSAETFIQDYAEFTPEKKKAYEIAATNIQIADNRYKNVSNELTAPLKAIVDGKVSAISSKDELKNAAAMIFGIKKNLGTNSDLKKAIRKVNKANNIIIVVPEGDEVKYPKEGVIGSINYNLNEINKTVNDANKVLGSILFTQEQQNTLLAIANNKDLSEEERTSELKSKSKEFYENNQADGTIKQTINNLTSVQKEQFTNAAGDVIAAVGAYGVLGLQCTKLGFNISKNPLLAAPLTFEIGALKDTASLIQDSASNLAKSVTQLKKVLKDNNISIANTNSAKTTGIKVRGLKNIKPVNFKK